MVQLQSSELLAAKEKIKLLKSPLGHAKFNCLVSEIRDGVDGGLFTYAELGMCDVIELLELGIECALVGAKTGVVPPIAAVRITGIYRCEQTRIKASRKPARIAA